MNEETALWLVRTELAKARRQDSPMHTTHEGWEVIKEKLDALGEIVRLTHDIPIGALRKEAVQVAAMGLRFLIDLCEPGIVAAEAAEPIENPSAELARLATLKMVELNLTYARAAEYVLRTSPALARAYREFVLNPSQGA